MQICVSLHNHYNLQLIKYTFLVHLCVLKYIQFSLFSFRYQSVLLKKNIFIYLYLSPCSCFIRSDKVRNRFLIYLILNCVKNVLHHYHQVLFHISQQTNHRYNTSFFQQNSLVGMILIRSHKYLN